MLPEDRAPESAGVCPNSGASAPPELLRPLPRGRTLEQVWRHYQVERELAERIRRSRPGERAALYPSLYEELFARVPDHPRMTAALEPRYQAKFLRAKLALLQPFLTPSTRMIEFGAGDCAFAARAALRTRSVIAADLSDQRPPGTSLPRNLRQVLYDGFRIEVEPASLDLAFSDQMIEHLHPDDVEPHFRLALRLLRAGGVYVLRTPHAFLGPHDVSRYFSRTPRGFHLKEWTFHELASLLLRSGYARVNAYWLARGVSLRAPLAVFRAAEVAMARLAAGPRPLAARLFTPAVCLAAWAPE